MVRAYLVLLLTLTACAGPGSTRSNPDRFFGNLAALCGARFEGFSSFPTDPRDAFHGKLLVATIAKCDERQIRIPFQVADDISRTWVLTRVAGGLQLKHDHFHQDGSVEEITHYGGTTHQAGTELAQSFPADTHTAKLIPAAATNQWFLSLSADRRELTYYLERHAKPRFKATLRRVD